MPKRDDDPIDRSRDEFRDSDQRQSEQAGRDAWRTHNTRPAAVEIEIGQVGASQETNADDLLAQTISDLSPRSPLFWELDEDCRARLEHAIGDPVAPVRDPGTVYLIASIALDGIESAIVRVRKEIDDLDMWTVSDQPRLDRQLTLLRFWQADFGLRVALLKDLREQALLGRRPMA